MATATKPKTQAVAILYAQWGDNNADPLVINEYRADDQWYICEVGNVECSHGEKLVYGPDEGVYLCWNHQLQQGILAPPTA